MTRALAVSVALVAAVAAQNVAPKPVEPAELPGDWNRRDLEGKWAAFRAATGNASGDARTKEAWTKALGAAEELELLEWVAVYEGWRGAGPELARLDAPQLMRAAAWNLGSTDSHNIDSAEKAMRERGGPAVGWFMAHPIAQRGKAAVLFKELHDQHDPEDASRYLPPHDPMQVLVPWLDAPADLADFGARLTAEPRVRYLHQVLRALDGVVVFGRPDASIVRKVLKLCSHAESVVQRSAFETLSKLPADLVPYRGLIDLANDNAAPDGRRLVAVTTLSYSSHPIAFFELHAIADRDAHPGRIAAIVRLGEIGDETTLAAFGKFALEQNLQVIATNQQAVKRIGDRKRGFEFLQPAQLRTLLQRVAWLRATGDARAEIHAEAAKRLLTDQNRDGRLLPVIDAILATKAIGPFSPDEAERVEAELRKFVEELRW